MSTNDVKQSGLVGKRFLGFLGGGGGAKKDGKTNMRKSKYSTRSGLSFKSVGSGGRLTAAKSKESVVRLIKERIAADKKRTELMAVCKQKEPSPFEEEFPESAYNNVERFDTGTYAEVFRGTDAKDGKLVVFKVIRAIPKSLSKKLSKVSFSGCTTFEDILSETIITLELSKLHSKKNFGGSYVTHCFPKVHAIKLVKGNIPQHFLREQVAAQTGAPLTPLRKEPLRKYYNAPMEHVVMAMKHNGDPMWRVIKEKRVDPFQLLSIAKQVTFGLAVAEKKFQFEHRDLHISNILIKTTDKAYVRFILDDQEYYLESCGVRACIIDTTFSRFTSGKEIYYKDMADILRPSANPPEKMSLQDHIYQRMVEETSNYWKAFKPKTNIFWLYYLYKTILKSRIVRSSDNQFVKESIEKILNRVHREKSTVDLISCLVEGK